MFAIPQPCGDVNFIQHMCFNPLCKALLQIKNEQDGCILSQTSGDFRFKKTVQFNFDISNISISNTINILN